MSKNLANYIDEWQMISNLNLGTHKSAMYTFILLYCQNCKSAPKTHTKNTEILHAIKAVWDEKEYVIVEHPSLDSRDSQSTEAVQYFLSLSWASKSYKKYAKKVHSLGRLATRLRASNLGWALYPIIIFLDFIDLFKEKDECLSRVQAHFERNNKPTPISVIRHYLKMKKDVELINKLETDTSVPPIEKYIKNLRK